MQEEKEELKEKVAKLEKKIIKVKGQRDDARNEAKMAKEEQAKSCQVRGGIIIIR